MTDSLKFGPEWLRNLAGDNCSAGGGGGGLTSLIAPRYQLADHRYGREEMLALFDRNYKPPETLSSFGAIFADKAQLPLALIQMTEDEMRLWNGGITSTPGRGRGGSVDRGGRGRIGRGGLYSSSYSRGFEESGDGSRSDTQPFSARSRPYERSQSERGWSERNGIADPGEWNGSTSPRKELGRGPSGGSLMESNWRRHRGGSEDDDGWRVTSNSRNDKWGGKGNWRDGGNSDKDKADGEGEENRSAGRWEHRGNHRGPYDASHHPPSRRPWDPNHHDNHDNLPEWATENPSESGGSFDASGAFHGGMYSDDDEDGGTGGDDSREQKTRKVSEGNTSKQNNKHSAQDQLTKRQTYTSTTTATATTATATTISAANKERVKSLHPFEDKGEQERPSLSPPRTATSRNSTAPMKAPPPTPESKAHHENFPSRKALPTEAHSEKKLNDGDRKPIESVKFKENKEENLNIDPAVILMSRQPPQLKAGFINTASVMNQMNQKMDEHLDRMDEEADALVAKLMSEDGGHRGEPVNPPDSNSIQNLDNSSVLEKWFYRDPQGEVQGPFLASEMAEWWKQGYFSTSLLVRRTCDERYASLGDLMSLYGRVPFEPGPHIPPLKMSSQNPGVPNPVLTGMPGSNLPKPAIDDPMLLLQYQRLQLMQNQMFLRQMAIAKLSQSEHWTSLSPMEQNQLILQYVIQESELSDMQMNHNPFVTPLATQTSNPVMQLFNQMQTKTQLENHLAASGHPTNAAHSAPLGFLQQMIQERNNPQNLPGMQTSPMVVNPASAQENTAIKSLMRQLNVHSNGHPQVSVDSVWPQPPPHIATPFNAQNWLSQVGPIPAMPPGQIQNSLWDVHGKDIKTEQQILEEQKLRLQDDKKEEMKKLEEIKRHNEEVLKQHQEERAKKAEEAKRLEEEKKRIEEEKKKRIEEERKRIEEEKFKEEELRKREEKKRKEEERKKEEKRRQEEELNKKRQEEEKKRKEEARRQEEKLRKEEEKRKKLEEEQKRLEEEARKKEEAAQRKAEAEEQARKAEQRRREQEALRKLQERSKAPWAQSTPAVAQASSLAEIQKHEREKKAEQQRFQQILQMQVAQQKALEAAQEAVQMDSSKRLQFKWAEKTATATKQPQVKSLAQIQLEEQERVAKERERQEKTVPKEPAISLQNAGIWGTASQSLTWANSTSAGNQAWTSNTGGFWDDIPPAKANAPVKQQQQQPAKPTPVKVIPVPQPNSQAQQLNNKPIKNKNKREEELVKKLFEQNTAKPDDFTQWCNKALGGLQVSVDIPTFIGFLRDIESAYEVKEYVRLYLGDDRCCMDFARQFLEKRSKWRSAQRPQAQADDLCKPAPAVNPNTSAEFQEVKGKSKKPKKGKMFKVDNRILGFSVTSAPDRINVGDRDYGEGF